MNNSRIRVRFAPSPTGHLHVGSVRSALFNWLFARHSGGTFLLRIEDTDLARSTQAFEQSQRHSMQWLGLTPDEESVRQTERRPRHEERAQELTAAGRAYLKDGALWFAVPRDRETQSFIDHIRGEITVPLNTVDDFVICRSDGSPIYNFCVVVDDIDMGITHIIRGDDHISNTIRQVLLYEALSATPPQFAHLPLIVGKDGTPLSKRDAATDVAFYEREGYLPEAMLNYLARLGWAHGDQEIFSVAQLVEHFTLDAVGKKSAVFDMEKLNWVQKQHLAQCSIDDLICRLHTGSFLHAPDSAVVRSLLTLYTPRVVTLRELGGAVDGALAKPNYETNRARIISWTSDRHIQLLQQFAHELCATTTIDTATVTACAKRVAASAGVGMQELGMPLRSALLGTDESPSIFAIAALLGSTACESRMQDFIAWAARSREA